MSDSTQGVKTQHPRAIDLFQLLASPATRGTGHCRQGTGASMIGAVVGGGS